MGFGRMGKKSVNGEDEKKRRNWVCKFSSDICCQEMKIDKEKFIFFSLYLHSCVRFGDGKNIVVVCAEWDVRGQNCVSYL